MAEKNKGKKLGSCNSTVVEQALHYPEVVGSNLAAPSKLKIFHNNKCKLNYLKTYFSLKLSYFSIVYTLCLVSFKFSYEMLFYLLFLSHGAIEGIRTPDFKIMSRVSYHRATGLI